MKPFLSLAALVIASSLSACGGGGDDFSSPPPVPTFPTASLLEYEGVWRRDAASDACLPAFPYNTAYHHRLRDISVVRRDNSLDATLVFTVYSDAGCSVKQGIVAETFALAPQLAALPGRTNALKGSPVLTASRTSADGGLGITLNKMPDGTLSNLQGQKYVADVDNSRLYLTTSSSATTLDSGGFPSALIASEYFIR